MPRLGPRTETATSPKPLLRSQGHLRLHCHVWTQTQRFSPHITRETGGRSDRLKRVVVTPTGFLCVRGKCFTFSHDVKEVHRRLSQRLQSRPCGVIKQCEQRELVWGL